MVKNNVALALASPFLPPFNTKGVPHLEHLQLLPITTHFIQFFFLLIELFSIFFLSTFRYGCYWLSKAPKRVWKKCPKK